VSGRTPVEAPAGRDRADAGCRLDRLENHPHGPPPGDWVRAQGLKDIESRVRECDEAIRAAVYKEQRLIQSMDRRAYLGSLALFGSPLIVVFGSLYLWTIVTDRVERSRMSLKPAIGILGLGAVGNSARRLVSSSSCSTGSSGSSFSTEGIYRMEGGALVGSRSTSI